MKNSFRGRPMLDIEFSQILEAVRPHKQVVAAARELGCSDSHVHVKLKGEGLSLRDVLHDESSDTLP